MAKVAAPTTVSSSTQMNKGNKNVFSDKSKPAAVRYNNIIAAKAVADAIRTSLGPKGMDKMIQDAKSNVTVTNDGATILKQMQVLHPTAKMLVELSHAQDIEAGDGTTSVVVLAGSLLTASMKLLEQGIHPTVISESFRLAANKCSEILYKMSRQINLSDMVTLREIARTSLSSKIVSQNFLLAPLAVNAVMNIIDVNKDKNVDLSLIRIHKIFGGTVDDTQLINGILLPQKTPVFNGPKSIKDAKIALIQFCISPPKTDMENNVIINDYEQMDRVLEEERNYILNIIRQIKKSGCNVLLIQKSILRDATNDLALHFLAKMKIMVVKDIERDEIENLSKTLGCRPIASIDHLKVENFGKAEFVEEKRYGHKKMVKIVGVENPHASISILIRGSNRLVLEEAERSLHDALCVIRCLVKNNAIISGGGAPEIELAIRLTKWANELADANVHCVRAFAEALEIIPYTLAENAGMNPIRTVTELRNRHAHGDLHSGIDINKCSIGDIKNVIQPLLVTLSAVKLATETVRSIVKIDDIVMVMRN
ncbi:hypothetical protein SNEBB_009891 [Seison nebaliae]|nr:hypothetical protein SNEBB_009891 [Seison nebaliae]